MLTSVDKSSATTDDFAGESARSPSYSSLLERYRLSEGEEVSGVVGALDDFQTVQIRSVVRALPALQGGVDVVLVRARRFVKDIAGEVLEPRRASRDLLRR